MPPPSLTPCLHAPRDPQNANGNPYIDHSASPDFTFGTIDLSNPDAVAWYASVIQHNMLARNVSKYVGEGSGESAS